MEYIGGLILVAVLFGMVVVGKSCSENTDKNRMECLKLGKTAQECSQLFHN